MKKPLEILIELPTGSRQIRFEQEEIVIGRGLDSDIQIDDPLASRSHCKVYFDKDTVWLEDLHSANGTWLHGELIRKEKLQPGDVFRIGACTMSLLQAGDALSAAEVTAAEVAGQISPLLEQLSKAVFAMEAADSLESLAQVLTQSVISLAQAERGFVFLLENGEISFAVGRNFAGELVPNPEKKVSRTLLERAIHSSRPLLLEDASADSEFAGAASISELGLRSLLVLPLSFAGDVVALVMVDHRMTKGAFRKEDVDLLRMLGTMASALLGAARERRSLKRTKRQLREAGRKTKSLPNQNVQGQPIDTLAGAGFHGLVGTSPAMEALYSEMERMLATDLPVLVQGESGTGKEMVARALHAHGALSQRPFVVENCGALPDTLLESELFGHVKGAFTGATRDRKGRFEEADGGTLFLDEVGEMSEAMQTRLLRVLQEGEIRRVGDDEVRQVNVRVLAASNKNLSELVKQGSFREDLFFRLNVLSLDLPPLRERGDDVLVLAEHFLNQESVEQGKAARTISSEIAALLVAYSWPGNVRELRNEIRRLQLLGDGPILASELSKTIQETVPQSAVEAEDDPLGSGENLPLNDRLESLERKWIKQALEDCGGNRLRASERLGISRYTLLRKIDKYNL